jgi:predicted RNA-binding Zn-ribbon protein involved in translation (DUF1610 family)
MITENNIKLLKNNGNRDCRDLEWIDEFYRFLQGDCPENIHLDKGSQPKLSRKKAFAIIWYLQEQLPVFPDNIERCSHCGELFDNYEGGYYSELEGRHYCESCDYNAETDYCDSCGNQFWKKDLTDFICRNCLKKEKEKKK